MISTAVIKIAMSQPARCVTEDVLTFLRYPYSAVRLTSLKWVLKLNSDGKIEMVGTMFDHWL